MSSLIAEPAEPLGSEWHDGVIARIRERIEQKMRDAHIQMSPSPHLIIEQLFPEDIYGDILRYNPFKANVGSEWSAKSVSSNVSSRTPYFARKQINFHRNDSFEAPPVERAFWDAIKDCFLADHWFEKLVHAKFAEYFSIRFGDIAQDDDFYDMCRKELFLQRHDPGYFIGPHTDVPTRIFTCIFSFADRPGFEQFGTEFLVPKDRKARCWGIDHYSPDDFEVKALAPYTPNNFLLFFKTRHSFHSVKAIDDTVPNQRYGMQFQFYEPYKGLFTDLSRPDLMSTRMAKQNALQTLKMKVDSLRDARKLAKASAK